MHAVAAGVEIVISRATEEEVRSAAARWRRPLGVVAEQRVVIRPAVDDVARIAAAERVTAPKAIDEVRRKRPRR